MNHALIGILALGLGLYLLVFKANVLSKLPGKG